MKIEIWTDGGCRGNGQAENVGGWGAYLICEELDMTLKVKGGELNTTNNKMELMGAIKGLQALKSSNNEIELYTDSAYVCNCINNKWYVNWQRNGWKTSKKKPVENKKLWEELLTEIDKHDKIEFIKVKGHANVEGNEIADLLTNQAMDELKMEE